MPPRIDDRWLWVGFGIFAFFAVKGIRYAIADLIHLTNKDPFRHKTQKNQTRLPEDGGPIVKYV